jgi:hypothetical protein
MVLVGTGFSGGQGGSAPGGGGGGGSPPGTDFTRLRDRVIALRKAGRVMPELTISYTEQPGIYERPKSLLDLNQILRTLAEKRPVFHSEADFQHALAWEIRTANPGASIRLELPVRLDTGRTIHLDLLVQCHQQRYAIELKYKRAAMTAEIRGEKFSLSNHGAQDVGRYDFVRDVVRLERYVISVQNSIGYAIFLSNDSLYWNEPRPDITSVQFSIHEDRELHSNAEMHWAAHAGAGSTKGRVDSMVCKFSYSCLWKNFSTVGNHQFKFLLLTIKRP